MFYPDALAAVTGASPAPFTGRTVAARQALPETLLAPCRAAFEAVRAGAVDDGFGRLQDDIAMLGAAGGRPAGRRHGYVGLANQPPLRAARGGSGRSARQIARRVRSWTGVSGRDS